MLNRIFKTTWLVLIGLAFLVSCTEPKISEPVLLQGKTMGTTYNIKYFPMANTPEPHQLQKQIDSRLVEINQFMSTYIPDSELSRLNKAKANQSFSISDDNIVVLKEAYRIHEMSQGAFDVTVGPLVNMWGFGPTGQVTKQPTEAQIIDSQRWVGMENISLQHNQVIKRHDKTYIDFSSIAKGYGVDAIANLLSSQHVSSYLVEIGGELRVNGSKPNGSEWKVAVEKPITDDRQVQLVFAPGNNGMATSGDYRNYFEENGIRFSHTINPDTGKPITHNLASVTVLHSSAMTADALATAINVLGAEKGLELAEKYDIAAYMLVKSPQGFEEVVSSAFKPYLQP